ncbi:hypothetical protein RND71_043288 [Anisodus tanguticus]|uniref:Glutaredoxin domain-containing protein n=1 Tax=Anisodus tanguticus TaxID=243964 RepID=A0AAE1QQ33_9SOLA|nr:hypothetical protein RND71_043288 [Anisodus tanguticus]
MASVSNDIDKLIKENRVLIFSKTYCPYCDKVKKLFKDLGVAFKVIELDKIDNGDELHLELKKKISRTSVPQVKKLFNDLGVAFKAVELDQIDNGDELHSELKEKISRTSVPQVFVNNQWVGGCDDTHEAEKTGKLKKLLESNNYDYDLIVIGGGSGGLAASKENVQSYLMTLKVSN